MEENIEIHQYLEDRLYNIPLHHIYKYASARAKRERVNKKVESERNKRNAPAPKEEPTEVEIDEPSVFLSAKRLRQSFVNFFDTHCTQAPGFIPYFDNGISLLNLETFLESIKKTRSAQQKGTTKQKVVNRVLTIIRWAVSYAIVFLSGERHKTAMSRRRGVSAFMAMRIFGPSTLYEKKYSVDSLTRHNLTPMYLAQVFSSWFKDHEFISDVVILKHENKKCFLLPPLKELDGFYGWLLPYRLITFIILISDLYFFFFRVDDDDNNAERARDVYEFIGVEPTITDAELRKIYRKIMLKVFLLTLISLLRLTILINHIFNSIIQIQTKAIYQWR